MNGSRSLGYTEKSQGRVTSSWSEAVCFLVPRLAAAAREALGAPGAPLEQQSGAHCSETRQNVQKEPKIQRHGFD